MTSLQLTLVALVTAVVGGGGFAAVIAKGMFSREYQKAKAGDVKIQAADKVIEILREQIDADRKECDRRIAQLEHQLELERADRARSEASMRDRIAQLEQVIQELRR